MSEQIANNMISYVGSELSQGNNDKLCDYCIRYYDKSLYLDNLQYCINCWSTMDNDNLNIETLTYKSDIINVDKVIIFIKKHYKRYINEKININRNDCIFNKIKDAKDNNKLHFLLETELSSTKRLFKNLDEYKSFIKERNPKLNFNFCSIDI
jgi:hypothetical protein